MAYAQLESFFSKQRLGKKWSLDTIRSLLEKLGSPEKRFKTVNVTGTNGKGSATAMIARSLQLAGLRVGSYYSPHVDDFCERIQVDGRRIARKDAARIFSKVMKAGKTLGKKPSAFEITTSMALSYFAEKKADYAVLEAGLGGRLDATNVGRQAACIITNVGLEHTALLGNSISSIAREKAGLLHEESILFTVDTNEEALAQFRLACKTKNSRLTVVRPSVRLLSANFFRPKYEVRLGSSKFVFSPRLLGAHQALNAGLAAAACRHLGVSRKNIERGISSAWLPARLEVGGRSPLVVFDAAHNTPAAKALASALAQIPHEKCIVVLGAMKDKDAVGVLRALSPVADFFVFNQPKVYRAMGAARLAQAARRVPVNFAVVNDVRASFKLARKLAGKKDLIACTGSIYMLGELRGKNRLNFGQ